MDSNGQLPPIILTRKKKEDPFSELLRRAELGNRIGRGSEATGLTSVGATTRYVLKKMEYVHPCIWMM